MSWPIQDLADAFFTLARSAPGSPSLQVLDGHVDDGVSAPYALVYFYIETPDGLAAPDAVPLTFDSDVIDAWAYVHNVGGEPQAERAARAVAGRFRSAVLNKTLTVSGRSCFPIRWREGQPPQRNEETGTTVADLVDVYSFRSVPG
ncbi:MAG TPA: hypothetical protein VHK64_08575 [Nocardioidaceae bacterium]|nr:hypothetical protein [Nocardioidaceae bacterium]